MTIRKTDLLEFIMDLITDPSVVHNITRAHQNMRLDAKRDIATAIDKRFPEVGDIEAGGVNGELLGASKELLEHGLCDLSANDEYPAEQSRALKDSIVRLRTAIANATAEGRKS